MAVIFSGGLPARITVADFKRSHLAAFPRLANAGNDPIVQESIEAVYDMFTGVSTLWATADEQEWYDKTVRCYKFLVAWYIADLYPTFALGVQSTGGMQILSKKIGDVTIHYADTSKLNTADSVLESLRSNPYGNKALVMIRSAPGRFTLRVTKVVG